MLPEVVFYYNIDEMNSDALKLLSNIPAWSLQINSAGVLFILMHDEHAMLNLLISNALKNTVTIRGELASYIPSLNIPHGYTY